MKQREKENAKFSQKILTAIFAAISLIYIFSNLYCFDEFL